MKSSQATPHRLPVTRTAHYYTLGEGGEKTKRMWLVCHGYGQSAARFIDKFSGIAGAEDYVVAAEGLSRFYWGGFTGPIVSSWMTSGDRLDEIADFCAMLTTIYTRQLDQLPPGVEIILFGFSQGCATQLRWMMREQPRFDRLILWAGRIPEDLDYRPHLDYFCPRPIDLFLGDADPMLSDQLLEEQDRMVAEQGLRLETHAYSGDHRVVRAALEAFFNDHVR